MITRQDKGRLSNITQIGTGNYNEKTSSQYTDFCLMTADTEIAQDAVALFQNMLIGNLWGSYHKLLVAPVTMKPSILRLVDGEMARGPRDELL